MAQPVQIIWLEVIRVVAPQDIQEQIVNMVSFLKKFFLQRLRHSKLNEIIKEF